MTTRKVDFILNLKGSAKKEAKAFGKAVGAAAAATGVAVVAVGALTAGFVLAAKAANALIADLVSEVDAINTLAAATGLANETILALRQAARASGKALTDIVPVKLAKNMLAAADSGGAMAEAFERLEVEFTDSAGALRDANEVFPELIDGLAGMENRTEAAALAALILGKQGRELLTAFEDSAGFDAFVAQTSEFGLRVGPDAVQAIGEWQKANADLSLAFDDVKQAVVDAIGGPEGAAAIIQEMAVVVVAAATVITVWLDEINTRFATMGEVIGLIRRGDIGGALRVQAAGLVDAAGFLGRALAQVEERTSRFRELLGGGVGGGGAPGGARPGGAGGALAVTFDFKSLAEVTADELAASFAFASASDVLLQDVATALVGLSELGDLDVQIRDSMREAIADGRAGQISAFENAIGSGVAGIARLANPFGLGDLIGTSLDVLRNLDVTVGALLGDIDSLPGDLLNAFTVVVQDLIPALIQALPEFGFAIVEALLAGAQAFFVSLPLILGTLIETVIQAMLQMPARIAEAFVGVFFGEGGFLRGSEGNFLGTSFRQGDASLLGVDVGRQAQGGFANAANIPFLGGFQDGGFVPRTGMALVHQGEEIRPAGMGRSGPVSIVFNGVTNAEDIVREIRTVLGDLGTGESLTPFAS